MLVFSGAPGGAYLSHRLANHAPAEEESKALPCRPTNKKRDLVVCVRRGCVSKAASLKRSCCSCTGVNLQDIIAYMCAWYVSVFDFSDVCAVVVACGQVYSLYDAVPIRCGSDIAFVVREHQVH